MTSPTTGLNAIVTALKAIPALVALMDSADKITAYADGLQELGAAVNTMDDRSVLVAYEHTERGNTGRGPYDHYYSIFVRPGASTFTAFFTAIMNGEPAADGVKFQFYEVNEAFDPVEILRGGREVDADGHEFFRIALFLTDKLIDE